MSLQQRLDDDLKEAMRQRDSTRLSTIRLMKNAIKYEEISRGRPLTEEEAIGAVQKKAKQHRESIAEFRKGNRQDLVDKEEAELKVVQGYLPQQMGREELVRLAEGVIQEVGARGPADKGKVMGRLMPQVKGKTDGSEVNSVVTELLERAGQK